MCYYTAIVTDTARAPGGSREARTESTFIVGNLSDVINEKENETAATAMVTAVRICMVTSLKDKQRNK